MPDFLRRNEDRGLDEQEMVRKEEIIQEDMARMRTGKSGLIGNIVRTFIWIAILYVIFQLLKGVVQ